MTRDATIRATRWGVALAVAPILASCATTTTQLAPVSREAVAAEEVAQREFVVSELNRAQERLDDLAFRLLEAGTPLCEERAAPRIGTSMATAGVYEDEWETAARSALGLTDTLTLTSVADGSPAEEAGLRSGDRVLSINGVAVPPGEDAVSSTSDLLDSNGMEPLRLRVRRGEATVEADVHPVQACDFTAVVTVEGDINAFADGRRVLIPWAMMRFANDEELRGVLGHEIAHNAMGHIEARQQNVLLGGLLGAFFDVALATQGVNTGGENTASFMAAAARAFSQDFEREADYVGMYILARAGAPIESVPDFWRQFAQVNPSAISYASTHPTTAERFVRLRDVGEEIRRKQASGEALLPEMKAGR